MAKHREAILLISRELFEDMVRDRLAEIFKLPANTRVLEIHTSTPFPSTNVSVALASPDFIETDDDDESGRPNVEVLCEKGEDGQPRFVRWLGPAVEGESE